MITPSTSAIVHGALSSEGLLISADPLLLSLQKEAGGDIGAPLAVPQLAAIARLSKRLGVPVSRPIVAASWQHDISMWVRARPDGDGIALAIADWQEQQPIAAVADSERRAVDMTALTEGWTWQIDMQLRFQVVLEGIGPLGILPPDPPTSGTFFSSYFQLRPDAQGDIVMLRAFAQRRAFTNQEAVLAADPTEVVRLSGSPMFDLAGQLSGYRGTARPVEQANVIGKGEVPPVNLYPYEFGKRLDRSLRQPIGRIIANADTISAQREGPLRPDYAEYATDIAVAGRHLMALVDDLADLQAIDRPDFSVIAEEIDLADLSRRAAGLLSVKALDRSITIVAPAAEMVTNATGEFRRTLQILVNLIGNAVRYSPEGSEVQIVTEQDHARARVIVIDNGQGIAPGDRERIFEKFERLGRDDAVGSGLGLYISRRLARAMGGDVHIGGEPGEGARFILALPAAN